MESVYDAGLYFSMAVGSDVDGSKYANKIKSLKQKTTRPQKHLSTVFPVRSKCRTPAQTNIDLS